MAIYAEHTPVNVFAMIGLNGLGIFTAIHAYLRYRKKGRVGRSDSCPADRQDKLKK